MTQFERKYIEWEYHDIQVPRYQINLYKDCYENFGWFFIEAIKPGSNAHQEFSVENDIDQIKLKFKRNRSIENKRELDRLQAECERALKEIQRLEGKKSAAEIGPLIGFGTIGTISLVASIINLFSASFGRGFLLLIASLMSWFLAYYSFNRQKRYANAITLKIHEQLEVLYHSYGLANQGLV
ncbi:MULTISPECIES: hypothetical protein [unclassified Enterococcus]|uniref:hypothetical protein n=1 Tax=unclassified Enterococcus TaxID=2608891 RepID=UPI00155752D2|nr:MULTISPECIES: hypothetical protein [unclassified Enterococcus]MBS7578193.1 hypothetical protein [Enterococcus sp. MMGLQ5-2]MBS7585431.1 hypothetical protein [Enterococcus sp. MMGLQ5-1]NPD13288.1 hypothetical protein [Enterococcus sp. MMGLQ5-1]NPD38024.1 hypothetical protein [Enterococcus sp. MMGLQ5-2]